MNASTTNYAEPQAKSRLDTVATSFVLATILASILAGAFVTDSDPSAATGSDRYASAAEVRT